MIKSFCIKTNNKNILDYLLANFKCDTPNNFYLSRNKFKIYNNVIIHYVGKDETCFYSYVSSLIQHTILKFYEDKILNNLINYDYFYFSDSEKSDIFDIAKELIAESEMLSSSRLNTLYHICYNYVKSNKAMILDGFVNFRLREYSMILTDIISESVNNFTIKKEYNEFIELLQSYVNTTPSTVKEVHLIYFADDSLLLDEKKNIIHIDKSISSAKYLSDITFSSNDYCLNTLLNILPKKIHIHLLNNGKGTEFLDTLCAIFGKRIIICLDCNICNFYKANDILKKNN